MRIRPQFQQFDMFENKETVSEVSSQLKLKLRRNGER